jgi:hypothetical protein
VAGLRVAGVEAEGRLAVGPDWYQAGGPAGPECGRREEPACQLASLVFQRQRRHGQPDILGEQRKDAVHVGRLKCPGQPVNQLPLGGRARRRGRLWLR